MGSFNTAVSNLSWTVTNGIMAHTVGGLLDTLQSKLANGGRDSKTKFYYDMGRGGVFTTIARTITNGVVSSLTNEAISQYKKLAFKKVKGLENNASQQYLETVKKLQEAEEEKYGFITVNIKDKICAYDDWGNICCDALMLAIPVAKKVPITQSYRKYNAAGGKITKGKSVQSDHLVWYDTVALVNVSSDKNLIITSVQGRDYSRKELVSNGDIKFSVSGSITSNVPDIYPASEVQKFRQIMQYKGIVKINNEILDQWGVSKILITSFSLPSNEGNKCIQNYSFEAVGIQPDKEACVTEDTVTLIDYAVQTATDDSDSLRWKSLLSDQLTALKSAAVVTASVASTELAAKYLSNSVSID